MKTDKDEKNQAADSKDNEGPPKTKDASQFDDSSNPDLLGELEADSAEEVISTAPEEPKPKYPERRLLYTEISGCLSMLGKIADGHGYAYLKAKIRGLNLTEISAITSFKHLQYLDFSNNALTLEALQAITEMPYLVSIQADKNVLESAALNKMKYLQVMIMNKNFIHTLEDIYQPELSTLELGENKISTLYFKKQMTGLRCLDLRYNLLEEITEIDFPNLVCLYLAENKILELNGIERLVHLKILHVRHNPIKLLTAFTGDLQKLEYINLRNCKVATLLQVKKLRVLTALRTLILRGCPYMGGTAEDDKDEEEEDDQEIRTEVLAALPRLTRLNKTRVTTEERTEANNLMTTWLEEGEKDEEEITEEMQHEGDYINED